MSPCCVCRYTLADVKKEEVTVKAKSAELAAAAAKLAAKFESPPEGMSRVKRFQWQKNITAEGKAKTATLEADIRTLGDKCYARRMELFVRSEPLPPQDMNQVAKALIPLVKVDKKLLGSLKSCCDPFVRGQNAAKQDASFADIYNRILKVYLQDKVDDSINEVNFFNNQPIFGTVFEEALDPTSTTFQKVRSPLSIYTVNDGQCDGRVANQ